MGVELDYAPTAFRDSSHQCLHYRIAASDGIVQCSSSLVEVSHRVCHSGGNRAIGGQAGQGEAEELKPVLLRRITYSTAIGFENVLEICL